LIEALACQRGVTLLKGAGPTLHQKKRLEGAFFMDRAAVTESLESPQDAL